LFPCERKIFPIRYFVLSTKYILKPTLFYFASFGLQECFVELFLISGDLGRDARDDTDDEASSATVTEVFEAFAAVDDLMSRLCSWLDIELVLAEDRDIERLFDAERCLCG